MPEGVVQWFSDRVGEGVVIRNGRRYPARAADVAPSARHPGARVHFDVRRDGGVARAIGVELRAGTRTSHRHRRFGALEGARQPETKGAAPFATARPDLGLSLLLHPLEIARSWADSITRGDLEAAMALYAPDAAVHVGADRLAGRRHIRSWLDTLSVVGSNRYGEVRGVDDAIEVSFAPIAPGSPAFAARVRVEHGLLAEQWVLEPTEPVSIALEVEAGPVSIDFMTRGEVASDAVDYARERIGHLGELLALPVLYARVKLERLGDPANARPAVAQASFDLNGEVVRAHVAARSMTEAIDLLQLRLRHEIEHWKEHREALRAETGMPGAGEWRHGALATERPSYFDRPLEERRLVRHKTFAGDAVSVDEAIFDMDQLGYGFYLFADVASGADSLVERLGDGSFRLERVDHLAEPIGPVASKVALAPAPAPVLSVSEAVERLNTSGERFVFFANASTGRGNACYRRYDGHYGLIAPS